MGWILLGVLVLLVLLALRKAYQMIFYSPVGDQNDPYHVSEKDSVAVWKENMHALISTLEQRPFEWVSITSRDELRLVGRYYHTADGAPLDIAFHGYRGHAWRDFCGGSQISFELGHNLLMVDQRAHGESEGHTTTFGALERLDCLDWVRWANDRFDCPEISLFGVSMGAATVLLAAGLELPENVRCVVADCPYSKGEDILVTVGRGMGLPAAVVRFAAHASARLFGGFRLSDASPVDALRHAKVPVLLIHGEEDHLVPCEMSALLEKACASMVERHTFPNADHGLSYLVDRPRYTEVVTKFLSRAAAEK